MIACLSVIHENVEDISVTQLRTRGAGVIYRLRNPRVYSPKGFIHNFENGDETVWLSSSTTIEAGNETRLALTSVRGAEYNYSEFSRH